MSCRGNRREGEKFLGGHVVETAVEARQGELAPSVLMVVQRLEAAGVPPTDISIVANNSD